MSSRKKARLGEDKCTDGNMDTVCTTKSEPYPSITLDFGRPVDIAQVIFHLVFFSNPGPSSVFSVVDRWLLLRLELCDIDLWWWREVTLHRLREVTWPEERLCWFSRGCMTCMTWKEVCGTPKRLSVVWKRLCESGCVTQSVVDFFHTSNPDFFIFAFA